jgi:hypothetical protein
MCKNTGIATFSAERFLMSRSAVLVAILVLLLSPVPCATAFEPTAGADTAQTGSFSNGRVWRALTENEKIYYVTAIEDGLLVGKMACPKQGAYEQFFCKCTVGEIVTGISKFFEEPTYRPIPIITALRIYVMKAKGASQPEIDAEIQRLLRTISTNP